MGRIDDIATELAAGHPDTGAYNADDALAAAEMNAVNRPNTVTIESVEQMSSKIDTIEAAVRRMEK